MAPRSIPTILVVEDDDSIRALTQIALEEIGGWRVVTATGGEEALRLARTHRPDAVLLDVMMPGMDGPTTFRHLREDPTTSDIPVVLLSARVRGDRQGSWQGLAVAGVVAKPYDPMSLAADVAALLGW